VDIHWSHSKLNEVCAVHLKYDIGKWKTYMNQLRSWQMFWNMMQCKRCLKFLIYEICRFFNNKQVAKFFLTILRQGLLYIYAIAMCMNESKISLFWWVCQHRKAFHGFVGFQTHSGGLVRKQCRLGGCAGRARCLRVRRGSGQTISTCAGF